MDIYKEKDSEINVPSLCVGNVSKYFSVDNMKRTWSFGYIHDFAVVDDSIDVF